MGVHLKPVFLQWGSSSSKQSVLAKMQNLVCLFILCSFLALYRNKNSFAIIVFLAVYKKPQTEREREKGKKGLARLGSNSTFTIERFVKTKKEDGQCIDVLKAFLPLIDLQQVTCCHVLFSYRKKNGWFLWALLIDYTQTKLRTGQKWTKLKKN